MKNKRGGEKLLSIWWFFVLVIVGTGISVAVMMFYSADVDVREIEADILSEKIIDCIIEQGFLVEDITNENMFERCDLNQEIFGKESSFYFRISTWDEEGNKLKEDIVGGKDFEVECEIGEAVEKAEHYPKCVKKKEGVLYYENNKVKRGELEILTASNQIGK